MTEQKHTWNRESFNHNVKNMRIFASKYQLKQAEDMVYLMDTFDSSDDTQLYEIKGDYGKVHFALFNDAFGAVFGKNGKYYVITGVVPQYSPHVAEIAKAYSVGTFMIAQLKLLEKPAEKPVDEKEVVLKMANAITDENAALHFSLELAQREVMRLRQLLDIAQQTTTQHLHIMTELTRENAKLKAAVKPVNKVVPLQ